MRGTTQHFLALAQQHASERAHLRNEREAAPGPARPRDREPPRRTQMGGGSARCGVPSPVRDAWWYWVMRDRYAEALGWIDRALSPPGADAHPALRVRVLCIRGGTLWPLGRKREQPAVAQQAEAIARTLADDTPLRGALHARSIRRPASRPDLAGTLADEALLLGARSGRRLGSRDGRLHPHDRRGHRCRAARARRARSRSAGACRQRLRARYLLANASYTALQMGSDRDASDFVRRATPVTRELDSPYLMFLRGAPELLHWLPAMPTLRDAFQEELQLCRALVTCHSCREGVGGLAAVAAAR